MTTFQSVMIRGMETETLVIRGAIAEIPVTKGTTAGVMEMEVRETRGTTEVVPVAEDIVTRLMEAETTLTRVPATRDMDTMIRGRLKQTGPDYVIGVGKEDITPVSVRRPYHPAATEIPTGGATAGEVMARRREETDKEIR